MYHFIPINGPLFHWDVSISSYLSAFSGPIYSWAHFQHSVTYGPLLSFSACGPNSACGYSRPVNTLGHFHVEKNPLGCFHRVIKYGLLKTRYGPRIVRPMIGEMMIRPVEGPWILRPVKGPWIVRPVEGPWILWPVEGPWILQKAHGSYDPREAHGYNSLCVAMIILA